MAADRPPNARRVYNVTSPQGEQFRAAEVRNPETTVISAWSNRTGTWGPESAFNASDLAMPMHNLLEWDVEPDDAGEEEDVRPDGSPSYSYRMKQTEAKLNAKDAMDQLAEDYSPLIDSPIKVEMRDLGDREFVLAGDGKLILNARQWHPDQLAAHEREWKGLMVDSSADGTLLHQFGHILMQELRTAHGPDVVDAIVARYADKDAVSPYAMDSREQFEAESFVAMHTGRCLGSGPTATQALANAQAMWEELFAL
jgi:hypothetical protein